MTVITSDPSVRNRDGRIAATTVVATPAPLQPRTNQASRDAQTPEVRRLASLLEVSQALSGTLNLKSAMHNVLNILARHHGAVRSLVTLLHEDGELLVDASDGLENPGGAMKYRIGEGLMGRVVET